MTISNVSFVIISKDEVYALNKCLESIKSLNLFNCQVLCVDSGSSDNTLEVMIRYSKIIDNLSVFHIEGQSNAAVARNVGIKNACKEIVFFLDGDVEVEEVFIITALEYIRAGMCEAISGRLGEYQYSQNFVEIKKKIDDRYNVKEIGRTYFSGGIFICTRNVVRRIGLFDETLTRCQDLDYTLRLTTHYTMLEIPINMGIHHTVPYENYGRMLESIRNQHAIFLGRCYLKNISNLKGVINLLYKYSGNSLGVLFYIFFFISLFITKLTTFTVLFVLIVDMALGLYQRKAIGYRFVSHYIHSLLLLKGIIYFNKVTPQYYTKKIISQ